MINVPLRSNAGLELAFSNYSGAERAVDVHRAYLARMAVIHPTVSDAAYRRMRAMGEVAYSNALGKSATDWIRAHSAVAPGQASAHFREMFVPSGWKFDPVGQSWAAWIRGLLAQLTGILGILGMLVALARLGSAVWYPALYLLTVAVLISPFQPVVRYMYVIWPVLVNFIACIGLLRGSSDRAQRLEPKRFRLRQ